MQKEMLCLATTKIQRIIRDYYKQLYDDKMGILEEMNRFLQMYNLPRLDPEEIEIMNRAITSTEIETLIRKPPKNQNP